MATFIIGHGMQEAGDATTGIPARTVLPGELTFFTAQGSQLMPANGLAALEADSKEHGYTYLAGADIENYFFSPLADDERVLFETVEANSATPGDAYYIGEGELAPAANGVVRLCQSVNCQGGQHNCGGVLQFFPGDIIVLACRSDGASSTPQFTFGTTDTRIVSEYYEEDVQLVATASWFRAGPRLAELGYYDPRNPAPDAPDAQVELAYLLTLQGAAEKLEKYNTFREYYDQIANDNSANISKFIDLLASLSGEDKDDYDAAWTDQRVWMAIEQERHLAALADGLDSPAEDTAEGMSSEGNA